MRRKASFFQREDIIRRVESGSGVRVRVEIGVVKFSRVRMGVGEEGVKAFERRQDGEGVGVVVDDDGGGGG